MWIKSNSSSSSGYRRRLLKGTSTNRSIIVTSQIAFIIIATAAAATTTTTTTTSIVITKIGETRNFYFCFYRCIITNFNINIFASGNECKIYTWLGEQTKRETLCVPIVVFVYCRSTTVAAACYLL